MRYLLAALLLASCLMPPAAFAAKEGVMCALDPNSVVSRTASGIEQVSNVGDIQVHCSVAARAVSLKPGEGVFPIAAKRATAFLLLPDGATKEVAVEVKGGGSGDAQNRAFVDFYLHLPLDREQSEAEVRRALERVDAETAKDSARPPRQVSEEDRQRMVSTMAQEMVFQHRAGRFRVECHLTQGDGMVGTGEVAFEVLPKGRFSDMWPYPVAPK